MSLLEDRVRHAVDSIDGCRASKNAYTSIVYGNLRYILRWQERESGGSKEQQH
jgi:hypothetical protein